MYTFLCRLRKTKRHIIAVLLQIPRIDDTIDILSESKWFFSLYLKSEYWQTEIRPQDKENATFTAGKGLWQFDVTAFRLCNATATFKRGTETVSQGLKWKTCLVYLDDVIAYGRSFEEPLKNLEDTLMKQQATKLKLKPNNFCLVQRG